MTQGYFRKTDQLTRWHTAHESFIQIRDQTEWTSTDLRAKVFQPIEGIKINTEPRCISLHKFFAIVPSNSKIMSYGCVLCNGITKRPELLKRKRLDVIERD